jgi:Histidine kinase-, DNA gyrase B-, and HSP90-like ATPase
MSQPEALEGNESFEGEIVVSSQIVDALSSGLYESPAACLKELVNNAYDADAQKVDVFVKPDADEVVIADDGTGMNREEFERHFKRISESHKRDGGSTTRRKRLKIGKIGIGFIAANELCDLMEIESTKRGSKALLKVTIDFEELRNRSPSERREGPENIKKGHYQGYEDQASRDAHYTRVFLRRMRGEARAALVSPERMSGGGSFGSVYGRVPDKVVDLLRNPELRSWTDLDRYSQTYLGVALNVPVPYPQGWMPAPHRRQVQSFTRAAEELDFEVLYDGTQMFKPTVLPEYQSSILRMFEHSGEQVSAKGYFFASHGTLRPRELQGVLIRIRHAAVGGYDGTFLDFPIGEGVLFKNWISGEIWASDELEDAMNIDRKTLRSTHIAYVELQDAFHKWFVRFLAEVRKELYARGSNKRHLANATEEVERISSALKASGVSKVVGEVVRRSWPLPVDGEDKRSVRRLNRKVSVGELYATVLEVAAEHMSKESFDRFVLELTRRLSD